MKTITSFDLVKLIGISVAAMIAFCFGVAIHKNIKRNAESKNMKLDPANLSHTDTDFGQNFGGLTTIKHDNHWFVIWKDSQKGGILHHPSCPECVSK